MLTERTCAKAMLWVHGVVGDGMVVTAEHKNQGDLDLVVTGSEESEHP